MNDIFDGGTSRRVSHINRDPRVVQITGIKTSDQEDDVRACALCDVCRTNDLC